MIEAAPTGAGARVLRARIGGLRCKRADVCSRSRHPVVQVEERLQVDDGRIGANSALSGDGNERCHHDVACALFLRTDDDDRFAIDRLYARLGSDLGGHGGGGGARVCDYLMDVPSSANEQGQRGEGKKNQSKFHCRVSCSVGVASITPWPRVRCMASSSAPAACWAATTAFRWAISLV